MKLYVKNLFFTAIFFTHSCFTMHLQLTGEYDDIPRNSKKVICVHGKKTTEGAFEKQTLHLIQEFKTQWTKKEFNQKAQERREQVRQKHIESEFKTNTLTNIADLEQEIKKEAALNQLYKKQEQEASQQTKRKEKKAKKRANRRKKKQAESKEFDNTILELQNTITPTSNQNTQIKLLSTLDEKTIIELEKAAAKSLFNDTFKAKMLLFANYNVQTEQELIKKLIRNCARVDTKHPFREKINPTHSFDFCPRCKKLAIVTNDSLPSLCSLVHDRAQDETKLLNKKTVNVVVTSYEDLEKFL